MDQLVLPPVLDAFCGPRMMWFDRSDRRALFIDKRQETHWMRLFVGGCQPNDIYWYIGGPMKFSIPGVEHFMDEQRRIRKYSHWAYAPDWLMTAPPGFSHHVE